MLRSWRRRSALSGDADRVVSNLRTGYPLAPSRYAEILRLALDCAGIEARIWPFHRDEADLFERRPWRVPRI